MTITALVFDLGGVVFDFSFDKTFDAWAAMTGRTADDFKTRFEFSGSFEKFERNDISQQQFIEDISQQLNYDFDESTFEKGWNSIYMNTFGGIDNLLATLKENYRLVALTNTNIIHSKEWKRKYKDTLQHFEKVFSSHEIRTRKPETKAFQTVLDYLDLPAQRTIFLDDNEEYVMKAKQLGINAVWVTSYNQMIEGLKKLGIYSVPRSRLPLKIRAATNQDASKVSEVFERAFAPLASIYKPKGDVKLHYHERSKKGTRLVAEIDSKIVGTVQYESHNGHLHIMGLAVQPNFQHNGIASRLIESVCSLAPSLGHNIVRVDTVKETGNVAFFEKIGFSKVRELVATWCISDSYETVHDVIMDMTIKQENRS